LRGKHKIREARNTKGLTQKSLGASAGVSASTISHIECHRGPDVPRAERRPTKTRFSTALKLSVALAGIKPGDYTFEEFVKLQSHFGEAELYEALVNQQARDRRRRQRRNRHLRSVA
jgi:transcriptional regulator with XRE-family HTH domain